VQTRFRKSGEVVKEEEREERAGRRRSEEDEDARERQPAQGFGKRCDNRNKK